jgi:hypothetical protein
MISLAKNAAVTGQGIDGIEGELTKIASPSYLPPGRVRDALVAGWEGAANEALEDNVLSREEEERLNSFRKRFGFTPANLNVRGAWTRIVMGAALRDLFEGKLPARFQVPEQLPFNLHTSETLVWAFEHVKYYEKRTRTTYVGGSEGMSVRMMSGVYFRTSSFRGAPVTTPETILVDTGMMGVTTKHIYFAGARKGFRIPYAKIVTFAPFSDAIEVVRDAASAKPQIFLTGEGWFVYNLVRNLATRDEASKPT